MLPTGDTHLAFRLSGPPLWLHAGDDDLVGRAVGTAIVGGARAGSYVRGVAGSVASVGAQLAPGAAIALFGLPADELSDRHTILADLMGPAAASWGEQLAEVSSLEGRIARLEALLASRLREPPAGVAAWAMGLFRRGDSVGEVIDASGYSHRHFLSLYRREVGLAPKLHLRVMRFQRAVTALSDVTTLAHAAGRPTSLAAIAHAAGYADQAHLTREFRALSEMTPGRYLAASASQPNHVPLVNFVQDPSAARVEDVPVP